MFWLTGSQKFSMTKNLSDSLAGRAYILEMSSLTQGELNGKSPLLVEDLLNTDKNGNLSIESVYQSLFNGSMPERIV